MKSSFLEKKVSDHLRPVKQTLHLKLIPKIKSPKSKDLGPDIDQRICRVNYRLRLISSDSISSVVVMILELAWKPRWVVIILTNS